MVHGPPNGVHCVGDGVGIVVGESVGSSVGDVVGASVGGQTYKSHDMLTCVLSRKHRSTPASLLLLTLPYKSIRLLNELPATAKQSSPLPPFKLPLLPREPHTMIASSPAPPVIALLGNFFVDVCM
jgi:xanthosine utilization system XapX-like protein